MVAVTDTLALLVVMSCFAAYLSTTLAVPLCKDWLESIPPTVLLFTENHPFGSTLEFISRLYSYSFVECQFALSMRTSEKYVV